MYYPIIAHPGVYLIDCLPTPIKHCFSSLLSLTLSLQQLFDTYAVLMRSHTTNDY
jgi:hypothetical protein